MTAAIVAEAHIRDADRPRTRPTRKQTLVGWSFALPFFAMFVVFMAGPILVSLVTSFTDLRVTDIRSPFGVNFVGLDNYADVFGDPKFRKAAVNTAIFVVVGVPLTMSLGLLAAVALNQGIVKFRRVFRVGFYLPVVTSIVAIAVVWRLLLGTESGLDQRSPRHRSASTARRWLTDTKYALPSLIVMAAWKNLGFSMIVFLAGLQSIPTDLYEAAAVDGARRLAAVPLHHVAAVASDDPVRRGDHDHRLRPVLRGAVRDDPGRPARLDPVGLVPRVQPVQLRQLRLHRGGQLRAVPRDRRWSRSSSSGCCGRRREEAAMTMTVTPPTATAGRSARQSTPRGSVVGRRNHRVLLHVGLVVGLMLMIGPFVWMILGSFKTTGELRQVPPTLIPEDPTVANYRDLFDRLDFPRYFFNSTVVALAVTAGNLLFCSMLGYALAKLEFAGQARCCSSSCSPR